MKETFANAKLSRRSFHLTAVGIAAMAGEKPLSGQQKQLPPAVQLAVEAKYANVIRKYGERLSEAQRVRVRETLVRHQQMLERVRTFALKNSDSPAFGFTLYPPEDRKKEP